MQTLKLGKKAPRLDRRVPELRKHLSAAHLSVPAKQDWAGAIKNAAWPMMLNDQLGDCVIASKGHAIQLFTALTGAHHEVTLPDSVILQGYETIGGYVPGNPSTDNGCDMLTAIQYWRATGYGGHRISGYATVKPADIQTVQAAVNLFGLVEIGVALPLSAQAQTGAGRVWDVPPGGATGNGAPGSWGGHCIPIVAYDAPARMYHVLTWGTVQLMSEAFLTTYADEAFAVLSPDWIAAGNAPNKFNLAQLQADLSVIASALTPTVNISGILAWAKMLFKMFGPLALPIIEGYVAQLPLTPAQESAIDAALEALVNAA